MSKDWNSWETKPSESSDRRLTRNTVDGKLGGVCAGIADYLGWDQTMVRILTILLFIFTGQKSGSSIAIFGIWKAKNLKRI